MDGDPGRGPVEGDCHVLVEKFVILKHNDSCIEYRRLIVTILGSYFLSFLHIITDKQRLYNERPLVDLKSNLLLKINYESSKVYT